jgi:chromosomal replication initiation ATPase DnaA
MFLLWTTSSLLMEKKVLKTNSSIFFNSLYEMNKQIIFSSDKHPNLIAGLEDRLRSRFNHGMIVDINVPSVESRLAILLSKTKDSEIRSLKRFSVHSRNNSRKHSRA